MSEESNSHAYLKPEIYVLHVEDDRSYAIYIANALKNIPTHKFNVTQVPSIKGAIAEYQKRKPDVILLDLTVEDSTGIASLEGIRGVAASSPIVITTGDESQLLVQTAIRNGAQDYLFKSNIDSDVLNRTICNAIDLKKIANENHDKSLILEAIMKSEMICYWDWNIKDNHQYTSYTFKQMLGYEDHEIGGTLMDIQKLMHPSDSMIAANSFKKHIDSNGQWPYHYVARFYHKGGSILWVGCQGKVVEWDEAGAPVRMVGCYINMTLLDTLRENDFSADSTWA